MRIFLRASATSPDDEWTASQRYEIYFTMPPVANDWLGPAMGPCAVRCRRAAGRRGRHHVLHHIQPECGPLPSVHRNRSGPTLFTPRRPPGRAPRGQSICRPTLAASPAPSRRLSIGDAPTGKQIVLIGTLGKSPLIDQLVAEQEARCCRHRRQMGSVSSPRSSSSRSPGVDRALVIAGSDKRGTIYGMYDLSAQIGVSPWYWWADVPVREADRVCTCCRAATRRASRP